MPSSFAQSFQNARISFKVFVAPVAITAFMVTMAAVEIGRAHV